MQETALPSMLMSHFLGRLAEYTQKDPGAVILYDEVHAKGISYAMLDDLSGRVYAWRSAV